MTVTVLEFQKFPGEEEDDAEHVCSIGIDYADGIPKLAVSPRPACASDTNAAARFGATHMLVARAKMVEQCL